MLTGIIIKRFVKSHENTGDKKVREAYGIVSSVAGLIVNFVLFLVGLIIGLSINSIAVVANSFNSLSDAASSVITLFGFKLSNKPADREHPFGHGRIEYLSALVVAALILMMGYEFIKSSILRITNPEEVKYNMISFIIILVTIPMKLWLSRFNKSIGKKIDSSALKAAGADAFNDALVLLGIIFSLIISYVFHVYIDGYVGIAVAGMIILSGISIMKDTLDPLLGQAPDPELVKELKSLALSYEHIIGVHDMVIHNYGPGRTMASLHVEVPHDVHIMTLHEEIDRAEKEISKKLNTFVVMHMDPVCMDCEETSRAKEEVESILKKFPQISSFHDFRVVGDGDNKNLIFDIVIPFDVKNSTKEQNSLKKRVEEEIKKIHPNYNAIITEDMDYTQAD